MIRYMIQHKFTSDTVYLMVTIHCSKILKNKNPTVLCLATAEGGRH